MNKNGSLKATPRLLQKSTRHSPQGFKPAPSASPESLLQILGPLCHSIRNARVDGYLDVLINPPSDAPTVKVYEPLSKDYVSRNVANTPVLGTMAISSRGEGVSYRSSQNYTARPRLFLT